MFRHLVDPNGHFYLNSMGNTSDADPLLTALVNEKRFLGVIDDKKFATQTRTPTLAPVASSVKAGIRNPQQIQTFERNSKGIWRVAVSRSHA